MKNMGIIAAGFLLSVLTVTSAAASNQGVKLFEKELINLESADIEVFGGPFVYCGAAIEPEVRVTLNGKILSKGTEYMVEYDKNVEAGKGKIKVVATGDGYTGIAETVFPISPYPIQGDDLVIDCQKAYDGTTNADPLIRVEDAVPGGPLSLRAVSAAYETPYVGQGIKVTIPAIEIETGNHKNYALPEGGIVVDNGVITSRPPEIAASGDVPVGGATLDLMDLVEAPREGSFVFTIDGEGLGSSISGTSFTSGHQAGTVMVNAALDAAYDADGDGQPEYTRDSRQITIRVMDKLPQPVLTIVGETSVTYGQTLALKAEGGAGKGKVTYAVRPGTGAAAVDAHGVLTPVQAGTVYVKAVKAGDDTYRGVESNETEITIQKAQITIVANEKRATVGDEVPDFTEKDYTVKGLVGDDRLQKEPVLSYVSLPDLSQPGTVGIHVSGAAAPENGNYLEEIQYEEGELIIEACSGYRIVVETTANGVISADQETGAEGSKVVITAIPDRGYELKELSVKDEKGQSIAVTEKGGGVYTFLMPESSVRVYGAFEESEVVGPVIPFPDVQETDWFYESVNYVSSRGLMEGMEGDLFRPEYPMTRGMVVTVLYRMSDSPEAPVGTPFEDVSQDQYYGKPVAWAAWYGIVNGYEGNRFLPDRAVTREELAVIFYRYTQHMQYDTRQRGNLLSFADYQNVQPYSWEALSWACGAGLINGMDGNRITPQGLAERPCCSDSVSV
ncbi:MAG: S-layer homology domain-containing protein [Evtepia sp.]|uniref:S-layer homology domain-containing protein n=1 Tax=Evtepia sp. TaxID=2773933 RepID=UPI002A755FCD|nr:S-layer homology domain-containing protein [Evtepia sp.]MDY3014084.1 S-layer homology domain-containing protein [Evtepia sp.]